MSLVNAIINQSQYVLAPSLQMFFIDPVTCAPLDSGIITFYRDKDRIALKPVFRIGGTPEDPTFIELPNPITLNSCGVFIDPNNGDTILPYYNILDDDGNIDLYYITIADKFGSIIETLEHFPQVDIHGDDILNTVESFVPNGQFLLHNDLPNDGVVSQDDTPIAYGGWSFVYNSSGLSTNIITFDRYNSPIDNPASNPRYSISIQCSSPDPSDSRKDLILAITDVNFLQSQPATFSFVGFSKDGGDHNIEFIIRKVYGQSGSFSPPTEEVIDTFTLTPQIDTFVANFTMSSNIGKILGQNNDDNVQFILRSPLSSVSHVGYTNLIGIENTFDTVVFPDISPEQTKNDALPASFETPNYDRSDIDKYVNLIVSNSNTTRLMFGYDFPVPPGSIIPFGSEILPNGFLPCDGDQYSQNPGTIVEYPRLFNVIRNKYGSGVNGFFNTTNPQPNRLNVAWNRFDVVQAAPLAGTSGFTFTLFATAIPGVQPQIYFLDVLAAASITPGAYYIQPVNTSGVQFVQLFYITIDGVGSVPNIPFDSYAEIPLLSSDNAQQVRDKVITYANGLFQTPDYRGYFMRFWNGAAAYTVEHPHDPDAQFRVASGGSFDVLSSGALQNNVGSFQYYALQNHQHFMFSTAGTGFSVTGANANNSTAGAPTGFTGNVDAVGSVIITNDETRPSNLYCNAMIKY